MKTSAEKELAKVLIKLNYPKNMKVCRFHDISKIRLLLTAIFNNLDPAAYLASNTVSSAMLLNG